MSIDDGSLQLNYMKAKVEMLKQKLERSLCLSYELLPLQPQLYQQEASKALESLANVDPQEKQLSQYDQIILGKVEGQLASCNFQKLLEPLVGKVSGEKLKGYLKQKTQQKNYGKNAKDKNCCIRQVKKLQYLKKYFDTEEISKKRKRNNFYRNAVKSLHKFFQLYEKINQSDVTSIKTAFQQFNYFNKQDNKYQQFLKKLQAPKNLVQKQLLKQLQVEADEKKQEPNILQGTENVQKEEQKYEQQSQGKKQQKKTPKKTSKKSKKSQQKASKQVQVDGQVKEGQENKDYSKEGQQKSKQQKNESGKKTKQDKKLIKSNMSIFAFLPSKNTKKTQQTCSVPKVEQIIEEGGEKNLQEQRQNQFWKYIDFVQPKYQILSLRKELKSNQMQNEQCPAESYFVNIIMTLSTIEYTDYLLKPTVNVEFSQPFQKIKQVLYFEDESQEFEGQSADGQEEEEEQEEEQQSGNNTIVHDSYLSEEEISSFQSNQVNIKVEYGKGLRWQFDSIRHQEEATLDLVQSFTMIRLDEGDAPLRMDIQEEKFQFVMTNQIWRDIYSVVHGYFGIKDQLIKEVLNILPAGVSKTWVDSMIKERSQKINNQRIIKPYFIQQLKQKIEDIDQVLFKAKQLRDQQIKRIKAQKNQQKDLKLEKDILQCTGSKYIVNLLKQLKQKGYKQLRKTQLAQFINERTGQQWDAIKAQMHTMSRPLISMMRPQATAEQEQVQYAKNTNGGELIQQVMVDDDQFHKIQEQPQKNTGEQPKNNEQKSQPRQAEIPDGKRRRRRTTKKVLELKGMDETKNKKTKSIAKRTGKSRQAKNGKSIPKQDIKDQVQIEEQNIQQNKPDIQQTQKIERPLGDNIQIKKNSKNIIPIAEQPIQGQIFQNNQKDNTPQPQGNATIQHEGNKNQEVQLREDPQKQYIKEVSQKERNSEKAQEMTVEKAVQEEEQNQNLEVRQKNQAQSQIKSSSAPILANVD